MPVSKLLNSEDKLAALRKADPLHIWESLDSRVSCVLCEKTFSGRQVEATATASGRVRLHCPTDGCCSTPEEWVHPGNPLVSAKAWQDWERVLAGSHSKLKKRHAHSLQYRSL